MVEGNECTGGITSSDCRYINQMETYFERTWYINNLETSKILYILFFYKFVTKNISV